MLDKIHQRMEFVMFISGKCEAERTAPAELDASNPRKLHPRKAAFLAPPSILGEFLPITRYLPGTLDVAGLDRPDQVHIGRREV
jgi:hypothetical protein